MKWCEHFFVGIFGCEKNWNFYFLWFSLIWLWFVFIGKLFLTNGLAINNFLSKSLFSLRTVSVLCFIIFGLVTGLFMFGAKYNRNWWSQFFWGKIDKNYWTFLHIEYEKQSYTKQCLWSMYVSVDSFVQQIPIFSRNIKIIELCTFQLEHKIKEKFLKREPKIWMVITAKAMQFIFGFIDFSL